MHASINDDMVDCHHDVDRKPIVRIYVGARPRRERCSFFTICWSPDERALSVDGSQNGMVVRTSARTLVLKSQPTDWTDVR